MTAHISWITKLFAAPALLAVALLTAAPALADAGDWIVRLRGIQLAPDEWSRVTVIAGQVDVDPDEVPEVDFTYFITNNWAAELILATTHHRANDSASTLGEVDLGEVSLLPPILTLQYHFRPDAKYRPYVGAGINYTIFYNEKAPGTTVTAISYDDSFGWALQAGIDCRHQRTLGRQLRSQEGVPVDRCDDQQRRHHGGCGSRPVDFRHGNCV